MGHGVLNLVDDHQSGRRGDDKVFASGMLMGMARRPIGTVRCSSGRSLSPDPLMGKPAIRCCWPAARQRTAASTLGRSPAST